MALKSSFLQNISILLTYVICLMSLQGIMSFGTTNLILFGVWLIVTLFAFSDELRDLLDQKWFLCIIPFLIYYLLSSATSDSITVGINRCVAFMSVASPVVMYEIIRDRSPRLKWFFLISIAAVLLVNVSLSYSFLDIVGEDDLRQNQQWGQQYYIVGIVFNMCYVFALLVPCLVDIFRITEGSGMGLLKRSLFLVVALLMLMFLVRAQFMTAILIAALGGVFAWFYKSGKKSLIVVGIAFVVVSILFIQIYPVVRNASQLDEFSDVTSRLDEVYATMTGNQHEASDMNSRQDLSMMSLETFFKHPIFGMNPIMVSGVHLNQQGIGNHATWPDDLALYGLFSIFIFVYLWNGLKWQRRYSGRLVPSVMFIALGFLNPLWYAPQMLTTFLISPMIYDLALGTDSNLSI